VIAFTDDDCEAQPGWLVACLRALEDADIVQGRTQPASPVRGYERTVRAEPPTFLWETCNLAVRRKVLEQIGPFEQQLVRPGRTLRSGFGEDSEWGWRAVSNGFRPAFVREALVHHSVEPRSFAQFLVYKARTLAAFPKLMRSTPEVRRMFYGGYFVTRRHIALTATTAMWFGAIGARTIGSSRVPRLLLLGGSLAYLSGYRRYVGRRDLRRGVRDAWHQAALEVVELTAAIYGSLRWRRLLL
jgi:hypothetical protein